MVAKRLSEKRNRITSSDSQEQKRQENVGKNRKKYNHYERKYRFVQKDKNILLYNEQMQRSHLEIIKKIMIYQGSKFTANYASNYTNKQYERKKLPVMQNMEIKIFWNINSSKEQSIKV